MKTVSYGLFSQVQYNRGKWIVRWRVISVYNFLWILFINGLEVNLIMQTSRNEKTCQAQLIDKKRQSKINKNTYKTNVTKPKTKNTNPRARYVTIIFANYTTNQINYAQTIYIQYANKYNKYKTGNWQRPLMKTRK